MRSALCWSLLSDAHQGENSGKSKEYRRDPASEKRGENPRFSEGYKNIKDDAIGKANHHATPNAQGYPSGPTGFQRERDANQDHDQV